MFVQFMRKETVAKQFVVGILIFSSCVTLLLTVIQLYFDYSRDLGQIDEKLNLIETSYQQSFAESLWVVDNDLVEVQMNGILKIPDIQSIEIRKGEQPLFYSGHAKTKNIVSHQFTLSYNYDGQIKDLGTCFVNANLDRVYKNLIDKAVIILISQGTKTFFVTAFIFFLFYHLIGRHLKTIAEYTQNLDLKKEQFLTLKRKSKKPVADELFILTESLNTTAHSLRISHKELYSVNKNLKESEEKYKALFERDSDAIFIYNPDTTNIVDANEATSKMYGYDYDELIGMSCLKFSVQVEKSASTIDKIRENDEINVSHRLHCKKDGTVFPVDISGYSITLKGRTMMYAVSKDITKRMRMEERLRQSEKALKASQRIAHLGSWRLDLVTSQVIWTEELYKMYGFDSTLPVPPYTEHKKLFTSDSWEILSTSLARTSETGIPYELELETVRKDGSNGWMWVRGEAIKNSEGNTIGLWGAAQDITERKQNEGKLSLQSEIITLMSEGVSFSDENGIIIYTNPEFERMFGYDPGEMIGRHISIANAPTEKHPEETVEEITNILNNEGHWFGEIQNIKKDGTTFWSSANVTTIEHLKYGTAFVSVLTDISELKQAKIEKMSLEVKLRQAQKMESIGNLAGGIAHDFNNLLFPIIGFAEMLKEDLPLDSPEHESAQEIFNAGKRGGELVKQILAFSRQADHKLRPVRVQKVLKEVLKLTRSSIPIDIEIQHDIQQNCGLVMADPIQLHQIGMNLITNAYHAVQKSGGGISVQLKEIMVDTAELRDSTLQLGQYAMVSVSDNGIGINRNVINNIFEPYFTTKDQGKGTGLGLAVVYGIVKELKGDIKVFSEEGKWTTFKIYLPLMQKSAEIDSADKVQTINTGTERILLVDDEISVAKLENQMLSRLGYSVIEQTTSLGALRVFKENPENFDLVVTDMTMPNMTGDKLAKEILSIRSDIPVIICTGFSERMSKEQAEIIGVKGFLMKPIVISEMAHMVRKVLDEVKNYNP